MYHSMRMCDSKQKRIYSALHRASLEHLFLETKKQLDQTK